VTCHSTNDNSVSHLLSFAGSGHDCPSSKFSAGSRLSCPTKGCVDRSVAGVLAFPPLCSPKAAQLGVELFQLSLLVPLEKSSLLVKRHVCTR